MQPRAYALTGLALAAGLAAALALPGAAMAQQRNCIDTLAGMPDYSRMVNAVTRSHMVNEIRNLQNVTIFAPTNTAISAVSQQVVDRIFPPESGGGREADPVLAAAAIQAHIVQGRVPASALAQGVELRTLAGTQLSFSGPATGERGPSLTAPGNITARIVQGDVPCSNGVIHGIDHALIR